MLSEERENRTLLASITTIPCFYIGPTRMEYWIQNSSNPNNFVAVFVGCERSIA